MAVLFRALTYATLFIALLLVFVPQRILTSAGIVWPVHIGLIQVLGVVLLVAGALLALACVFTFALIVVILAIRPLGLFGRPA